MADVTITINKPVIVAPAHFKVRYRELPSGSYSSYSNQGNTPFTISGLTSGSTYELEVIYVNGDGIECNPTVTTFEVFEPDPCIIFTVEILFNTLSRPYIHVTYSPPVTPSPCGYLLQWTDNNTNATGTILIPTLDPSGVMDFMFQNNFSVTDTFDIIIYAQLCNGLLTECYHDTVTPDMPPCIGIVINSANASFLPGQSVTTLLVTINLTNSTPATLNSQVTYQQNNVVTSGIPDGGSFLMPLGLAAGATGSFSFQVTPNTNYTGNNILYSASLTDQCNTTHTFTFNFAT